MVMFKLCFSKVNFRSVSPENLLYILLNLLFFFFKENCFLYSINPLGLFWNAHASMILTLVSFPENFSIMLLEGLGS